MKRQILHVTPFAEGWRVLNAEGSRVSELFLEREPAVTRALGLVEAAGWGKVVIHTRSSDSSEVRIGSPSTA